MLIVAAVDALAYSGAAAAAAHEIATAPREKLATIELLLRASPCRACFIFMAVKLHPICGLVAKQRAPKHLSSCIGDRLVGRVLSRRRLGAAQAENRSAKCEISKNIPSWRFMINGGTKSVGKRRRC